MSGKEYYKGDQLMVANGPLSGPVGSFVGYDDCGKVKIGISPEDEYECIAILTIPEKSVSLVTKCE